MLRIRLTLFGLLATFIVVGFAASADASNSEFYYMVEETEIGSKAAEAEGSSGTSKIEGVIGGSKTIVRCAKDNYSSKYEEHGKSKGSIEFKECKAFNEKETTEFKACKINEPITAKFTGKLIGKEESETQEPVEYKLSPEGTEFTKLEITEKEKEKCSVAGKVPVSGSQTCKLPIGEEEKTEHEIECTPSGSSKLKVGSEKANLTSTEKVKIKGGGVYAAADQPQPRTRYTWLFNNVLLTNTQELAELSVIGKFKIKGVTRSTDFLIECNTVESPAGAKIENGAFGKIVNFVLKIKGCTVAEPTGCTVSEPITTETLEGEMGLGVGASRGQFVIALSSLAGNAKMFPVTFNGGACSLKTVTITMVRAFGSSGTLAQIPNEQLATQKLKFETTENLNHRIFSGVTISSGLKIEGELSNRVTLGGELVVKLNPGGEFGPH